jgi:uncharacterized Zn finger protein
MAKQYGITWWGKQWLNSLTNIDNSNRLPRGRSYANTGKVRSTSTTANRISAKVQGSQPRPYQIDITVPLFRGRGGPQPRPRRQAAQPGTARRPPPIR